MIDIRGLSPSDRVNKLVQNVRMKYNMTNQSGFIGQIEDPIPDDILYRIFEKIESRIYYILDSPAFQINIDNKLRSNVTFTTSTSEYDLVNLIMVDNKDKYFLFYNIKLINGYYQFRHYSIDDPAAIRENKINKILDE